jgi:tetratricopeptide (TPR) repeat protein
MSTNKPDFWTGLTHQIKSIFQSIFGGRTLSSSNPSHGNRRKHTPAPDAAPSASGSSRIEALFDEAFEQLSDEERATFKELVQTSGSPEQLGQALAQLPRFEAVLIEINRKENERRNHLLSLFRQILDTQFWSESQKIIEDHPELLEGDAETLLGVMIEGSSKQNEKQDIETIQVLLRRCREIGIEAAFLEVVHTYLRIRQDLQVPPELEKDVRENGALGQESKKNPTILPKQIALLESMLPKIDKDGYPDLWAATNSDLALAYSCTPGGNREKNFEKAIHFCQQALTVYTADYNPLIHSRTLVNLGRFYMEFPTGDREANLLKGIDCYNQAASCISPAAAPFEFAATQNSLGCTYSELRTGDREANLQQAVVYFEKALEYRTLKNDPIGYAMTQVNLGGVYMEQTSGDLNHNIQAAIGCFKESLKVSTPDHAPMDYATAMNNLGIAYMRLREGDRNANLQASIASFQNALRFWTPANVPWNFAMANNNLEGIPE